MELGLLLGSEWVFIRRITITADQSKATDCDQSGERQAPEW